jgi:hypothetical protein
MPGEWARARGTVYSFWPLFAGFFFVVAFAATMLLGRHVVLSALLLTGGLLFCMLMWRKGMRRVESFFKGARGEAHVAAHLARLPETYHVFHDFPVGGRGYVDHVVVGETGVFCIETKNWSGEVTVEEGDVFVDGLPPTRPLLAQAAEEAAGVRACLQGFAAAQAVVPVVCFASNALRSPCTCAGGTRLVNVSEILADITRQPAVWTADDVARAVRLLEARFDETEWKRK